MNKNKNSIHVLVVAVIAAVLSTAFAVGLTATTSAAEQAKATDETIEKNNEGQSAATSAEHGTRSSSHTPTFAASNDLNQTKVNELRIAIHDLWVEHVVWTRHT